MVLYVEGLAVKREDLVIARRAPKGWEEWGDWPWASRYPLILVAMDDAFDKWAAHFCSKSILPKLELLVLNIFLMWVAIVRAYLKLKVFETNPPRTKNEFVEQIQQEINNIPLEMLFRAKPWKPSLEDFQNVF